MFVKGKGTILQSVGNPPMLCSELGEISLLMSLTEVNLASYIKMIRFLYINRDVLHLLFFDVEGGTVKAEGSSKEV